MATGIVAANFKRGLPETDVCGRWLVVFRYQISVFGHQHLAHQRCIDVEIILQKIPFEADGTDEPEPVEVAFHLRTVK